MLKIILKEMFVIDCVHTEGKKTIPSAETVLLSEYSLWNWGSVWIKRATESGIVCESVQMEKQSRTLSQTIIWL